MCGPLFLISLGYISGNGIGGSYVYAYPFEELPDCFPKWPHILHYHQQCMISPHPSQALLLSVFLIIGILVGMNMYFIIVLIFISLIAKKYTLYKRKKRLSFSRDELTIKSLMSQFQSQYELIFILFLFSSAGLSILCMVIV